MTDNFRKQLFETWAPAESTWSPWVKPVLFATRGVVVDLPGANAVNTGLELARRGWRPVPLFNAVPYPILGGAPTQGVVAVNVQEISSALDAAADELRQLALDGPAPPAFLLDSRRRGTHEPSSGDFDNRSISFPSDFPSARFLKEHGIESMTLIQSSALGTQPQADLAHTLRRWQEGGIVLELVHPEPNSAISPLSVEPPSNFKAFWYRFTALLGLQPTTLGGYGGMIGSAGTG